MTSKSEIISVDNGIVTIQSKVSLSDSMLDCEAAIQACVNEVGALATGEALKQFDADGRPIVIGGIKLTSRCKSNKTYKTPYADISVERHVYQTSSGGKVYVPLEDRARIVQGATPRFGKMLSHKYTNLAAPGVIEDFNDNHARKISIDYLQKVTDHIGSIAQATEESWEYEVPDLDKSVACIGISRDGAYVPTVDQGYRESMSGTISLYGKEGDRLYTIYVGASPEYGKKTFVERFEREIQRTKRLYPDAESIGVADGAQDNWSFLKQHTSRQILDFWHACEYLSEASHALFSKKGQNAQREQWLDKCCHDLKHKQGAASRILNELNTCVPQRLSPVVREKLEAAITYFSNNIKAGRMKYHLHTKNNWPIGSGVVEAACKTLIKQRLCASGMRWKSNGIKVILSLRSLVKTKGRWNQFWNKINIGGVPALC